MVALIISCHVDQCLLINSDNLFFFVASYITCQSWLAKHFDILWGCVIQSSVHMRRGRKEGEGGRDEKGIKMCSVPAPIPCNECDYFVLHICTKKKLKIKFKKNSLDCPKMY